MGNKGGSAESYIYVYNFDVYKCQILFQTGLAVAIAFI